MDERDQRIYKIVEMNDSDYVFEGVGCVDNRLIGSATTLSDLSHILINDYFGIEFPEADFIANDKLELLLGYEFVRRRDRLDGYSICGLTIKERLNGAQGPETVQD